MGTENLLCLGVSLLCSCSSKEICIREIWGYAVCVGEAQRDSMNLLIRVVGLVHRVLQIGTWHAAKFVDRDVAISDLLPPTKRQLSPVQPTVAASLCAPRSERLCSTEGFENITSCLPAQGACFRNLSAVKKWFSAWSPTAGLAEPQIMN